MSAGSLRARVRAEMTEEIKATARRHLATDGANLSLRAVARDMGMVSSALYRYFPSRDALLTALILDAYNALGTAAEAGDTAVTDRTALRARWLSICHAVRAWALANPSEYALLFGSPVPEYHAPEATTAAASRTPLTLITVLKDSVDAGFSTPTDHLPPTVHADMARLRAGTAPGIPEELLARGSMGWIQLFGAVSFELFGQLNNVVEAREAYFEYQMRHVATTIGIPE
ncbi:TetR/AcrR family transcriptional regulator [Umezawaea endophytica]|uniref:TetR/AcrR family transcriptional regulator n=1 Tax=Umezawaea endophytica TaxID=1654476 RepID=A0A9X3AHB7_9PSEU|nr:TetR/AcrR family transcriptional regulator [Umezawaea endophytica]MCS7479205.1 TetR/AcrR family transcriptional regulator [Umezawaea endophytica]